MEHFTACEGSVAMGWIEEKWSGSLYAKVL